MSGALTGAFAAAGRAGSVLSGLTTSATNLGRLLSGPGSSGGPGGGNVRLGPITLTQWEVPDQITWGTQMGLVEHRYPGGVVYYALTGPARKDISWQARMLGADAAVRARALDDLCARGKRIELLWASMSFDVLLVSFSADYKRENWTGGYSLTLKVFPDYAKKRAAANPAAAVKGGISGLISAVSTTIGNVTRTVGCAISEAQSVVGAVSSVVTPITNSLGIHLAALAHLQVGLTVAQSEVGGLASLSAGTAQLANATSLMGSAGSAVAAGVTSTGTALTTYGSVNDLAGTAAMAGAHASLVQMDSLASSSQNALADTDSNNAPIVAANASATSSVKPAFVSSAQTSAADPFAGGNPSPVPLVTNPAAYTAAVNNLASAHDYFTDTLRVNLTTPSAAPLHVTADSPAATAAGNYTLATGTSSMTFTDGQLSGGVVGP